jgi:hypothetical protein
MHLHNRTAEETIDCFKLSASLEYLTIEFEDGSSWRAEANNYCSKLFGFLGKRTLTALKSLSFEAFPRAVDTSLLLLMLDSGREAHGVANLESFRFVFDQPVRGYNDDCVSELRALRAQGLNIHIEWPVGETSENLNPEFVRFPIYQFFFVFFFFFRKTIMIIWSD